MAAITTRTSTAGGLTSFVALLVLPNSLNAVGTPSGFDPWPNQAAQYLQRVWDTGTVGWCYYRRHDIDPTPLAAETSPNYTGSISAHSLVHLG